MIDLSYLQKHELEWPYFVFFFPWMEPSGCSKPSQTDGHSSLMHPVEQNIQALVAHGAFGYEHRMAVYWCICILIKSGRTLTLFSWLDIKRITSDPLEPQLQSGNYALERIHYCPKAVGGTLWRCFGSLKWPLTFHNHLTHQQHEHRVENWLMEPRFYSALQH